MGGGLSAPPNSHRLATSPQFNRPFVNPPPSDFLVLGTTPPSQSASLRPAFHAAHGAL